MAMHDNTPDGFGKPPSREKIAESLTNLPDRVRQSSRFLVWKYVEVKGKKPRKVPFYASGRTRGGNHLDSPEDLAQLVTIDAALDAFESLGMSGIGLALTGEGVAAFDLDNCLDSERNFIPSHPGLQIAEDADNSGAYIEVSPSGRGLRILGASENTQAYSKDDVEYWGAGRYVTLTGDVWRNPRGFSNIEYLRTPLVAYVSADDTPFRGADDNQDFIVSSREIQELRSALETMSSDDRDLWIRVGHALKALGDRGKDLWLEWSAKSDKFDAVKDPDQWGTFRPQNINFRWIFKEAQAEWGWENPRSKKFITDEMDEADDAPLPDLLDSAINLGDQVLYPTEFVIDGFLPTGVSLIAGAWGAGKSTNLIPVFASVAHLAPEAWGLQPLLRRHIVWITEAPDQARDTIFSLSQEEGASSWSEFKEWFHLIPAHRQSPKKLAKMIKAAMPKLSYALDTGFLVQPVVVLDTTSANLDLENESDNSEVGKAMAALKEALRGSPLVLIGHTPKALAKSDIADMTFRGAGAWEADAVATYYLVHDQETDMRFMAVRKCRFTPDFTELSFGQVKGNKLIPTPWGEEQSKNYLHGVPEKSTGEERRQVQAEVREEKKEQVREKALTERQTKIVEAVISAVSGGELVTKAGLREKVGGKTELVVEAIKRLLEAELLIEVELPVDLYEKLKFQGRRPTVLFHQDHNPELVFENLRSET